MDKVLMFDTENGSQTLGGEEDIQAMFGLPVLKPSSFDDFRNVIKQLYEGKKTVVQKKIGNTTIDEIHEETVLQNGTEIDALVIDSFSELAKKYQRSLADKNTGVMKLQNWGVLKNTLDVLLEYITKIPGVLIMTCHSKTDTLDDGTTRIKPLIDGSTKEDISKWFDFVFYTFTKRSSGKTIYQWQTKHTEKYDHAKDRTDLLPEQMFQDFQIVVDAARKKGFKNLKILIIGSPGTGKTKCLETLKGVINGN